MAINLGVGINDDVIIQDVVLDDKLWTKITFKKEGEKAYNPFEAIGAENEAEEKSNTTLDMYIFNLKTPAAEDRKGNKRTQEQIRELATRDVTKTKALYLHLLKGYLTKDDIKFDVYRATGITTADEYNSRIVNQGVLDQITRNLATDFISMIKPFLGNPEMKFRLLLLRQSKDKHFAAFRQNYLEENPIWESMDVPKEASKVKFSAYEEKEGLNDATAASKSTADKPAEEAPMDAASVFGQ